MSVCGELISDFEALFLAATKDYCSTEQRQDDAVLTCDPGPLAERLCLRELKMCRPGDFGKAEAAARSAGKGKAGSAASSKSNDGENDAGERKAGSAATSPYDSNLHTAPTELAEARARGLAGAQSNERKMVILGEQSPPLWQHLLQQATLVAAEQALHHFADAIGNETLQK